MTQGDNRDTSLGRSCSSKPTDAVNRCPPTSISWVTAGRRFGRRLRLGVLIGPLLAVPFLDRPALFQITVVCRQLLWHGFRIWLQNTVSTVGIVGADGIYGTFDRMQPYSEPTPNQLPMGDGDEQERLAIQAWDGEQRADEH